MVILDIASDFKCDGNEIKYGQYKGINLIGKSLPNPDARIF